MKINITYVIALSMLLIGCKSIQITDLQPRNPNNQLLPSLSSQVDISSFLNAYSFGTTKSSGSGIGYSSEGLGGVITTGTYFGSNTTVADKRIQDAIVLFEREVRNNITNGDGTPVGFAICKIPIGETRIGGWGFYGLSLVTLTVPNWFGMPLLTYKTELELEVEIQDCNNIIIGRYNGVGRKKIPVALWHGYGGGGSWTLTGNEAAARKSNIEAIKIAMIEIKNQISGDYVKLKSALEKCN